ncbi:hypothetical protein AM228_27920 [Planktothricoides sp. SR001]|nr:hypothetical protein AM228_27920 [Planktothricoides sp. SR001]
MQGSGGAANRAGERRGRGASIAPLHHQPNNKQQTTNNHQQTTNNHQQRMLGRSIRVINCLFFPVGACRGKAFGQLILAFYNQDNYPNASPEPGS